MIGGCGVSYQVEVTTSVYIQYFNKLTLSTHSLCRVDITKKWLPHRLVQTKTHDISFILSAGLTTVLTWNQRHRNGRLIQDELKIYRRSYHPPYLNFPETLYSFKFLFLISSSALS